MPEPKASLLEMAEACQREAERLYISAGFSKQRWPDRPHDHLRHQADVFEQAGKVLVILATFEDRSRKFVAELIAEAKRG